MIAAVRFYTALSWNVILRSVLRDHHMRMSARNRLHSLLDEGSLVELGSELEPKDVLKFRDSKNIKTDWRPRRKKPARKTRWWS